MASFNIHSRFIRCNHAGFHHRIVLALRNHLEADAVGALMHTGQVADSMAGAMFIVKPSPPQWLPGCIVNTESAAAVKKLYIPQTQHAHKHQGKMLPFLICHRSQGNGPGNVRCSLVILAPGINEIQSPGLQRQIALRRG